MLANLCHQSMGMMDFPYWVQQLPRMLFHAIDLDEDGVISVEELRRFYAELVPIVEEKADDPDQFEGFVLRAFNSMTGDQHYPLDVSLYMQNFANFLLGKSEHGPGKFVLGVSGGGSGGQATPFVLDWSCTDAVDPGRGRRNSLNVPGASGRKISVGRIPRVSPVTRKSASAGKLPD